MMGLPNVSFAYRAKMLPKSELIILSNKTKGVKVNLEAQPWFFDVTVSSDRRGNHAAVHIKGLRCSVTRLGSSSSLYHDLLMGIRNSPFLDTLV